MARGITIILAGLALAVAGGTIHPFGSMKQDSAAPLFSGMVIDPVNLDRIWRSCGNCHSDHSEWPWYSYVAPASWMIERDVRQARAQLNFSRWPGYTLPEQITLLTSIGAVLRTDAMPPKRYRALHPESALSAAERNALYEWSKTEGRRLRPLLTEK